LFFFVLVPERREIICTEDRKDHEEETAGAWSTDCVRLEELAYILIFGTSARSGAIRNAFGGNPPGLRCREHPR
jgi:hypothetical protein